MADIQGSIVERPGIQAPADLANQIAIVGWFPFLNAATPQIVPVRRGGDIKTLVNYGKGSDLAGFALRNAEETNNPATIFCVPHPATVAGSITFDGQTGFGPAATLTAVNTHAHDDATVKVRVRTTGGPGTATIDISTAWLVSRDSDGGAPSIEPLREPVRSMPQRTKAALTGTVDITGIVYAKPAIVTGTVDLVNTITLYGVSGSLAGKEFDITIDGGTLATVTFGSGASAPASYLSVIATIDAAITGNGTVAVNGLGQLVLTGIDVSTAGSIVLAAGTPDALAPLGLTAATTPGTAGALDGLTILYEGDATSGAQTFTAPTGGTAYASAAAFVAALDALTGVDASLFSAGNLLQIGSATAGSASTFQINSGTALTALGLAAGSDTGADAELLIEHLGVKITFPTGTYTTGYERTWTVKAPACSATDVQNAIDALVAQEIAVGRVYVASDIAIGQLGAFIQAAAAKVGELEAANDAKPLHAGLMAPIDESDANVKAAYVSAVGSDVAVGRRVDLAARYGYARPVISSPNASGALKRSLGWWAVAMYAAYPLGFDLGQNNLGALRYCDYVPVSDDKASIRMGELKTQTGNPRALVTQKLGNGYYFCGGFTLAPSASTYADQYVRDIILRVFQLTRAALVTWLNNPTLPLDSTGRLTDEGAGAVSSTVITLLSGLLPPATASASTPASLLTNARVAVSTSNIIGGPSGSQRLEADVIVQVRGIARDIRFTVGAGLITEA